MGRLGRYHLRADLLDGGAIRCPQRGEDVDVDACMACTSRSDDGTGCWLRSGASYDERDPLPLLPFLWDEATSTRAGPAAGAGPAW